MITQLSEDLLVESKFKNLRLFTLMGGRTAADVCRECDVEQSIFGALLNLKISPINRHGEYRKAPKQIADFFKVLVEDLFPLSLYQLVLPKAVYHAYSSEEVMLSLSTREAAMLPASVPNPNTILDQERLEGRFKDVLRTLSPRKEKVIRMRFGLDDGVAKTREEIAEHFGLTPGRIGQIELRALRDLRHPARSRQLRPFVESLIEGVVD